MNHRLASFSLGLFGALLAAAPVQAQISPGSQVPFNSTSPPSPFNRFNSPTAPGQANATSPSGQYPATAATPGYTYQATAMNSSGAVDVNHHLTRGDSLGYRVAEDRDDKVWPLIVQDSGDVDVPLLGRVKAAGKTVSELSGDIKSRLESQYYWPGHATVSLGLAQVAPHANGRVFLTGELTGKGALDLPADGSLTVSQAILQMGGPTKDSNLKRVKVVRKNVNKKGFIEVNVDAVLRGDASKDVVLQPGDTVDVPMTFIGFRF